LVPTEEANPGPLNPGPLNGIKVLELGQLIAGPYAGSVLAYFGAEVIKVESPKGGDPLRRWRQMHGENSFWWYSLARNKKSITLDLNQADGQKVLRQLIPQMDVLVENFRPGVLEKWGLGPSELKELNPDIQIARISGYGQTGPAAQKPGFASVCEGFSGFRYVNGFEGDAPVRPNLSIGDTIAGMHAVMGILMGLLQRERSGKKNCGQVIDVSLYESMFSLMEAVIPEYTGAGVVRQPSGTTVTGIVPTNTYRCADGKYLIIGGNGDSIFKRLMSAIGHEDMANEQELAENPGRVKNEARIDAALSSWCAALKIDDAMSILEAARVPAGPIYSAEDIVKDRHYHARDMLEEVSVDGQDFSIPAYAPKMERSPGQTRWVGPQLGEHNAEIYQQMLGMTEEHLGALRKKQVI
jgi:crotonobetainyl-CoA:carnitine CoA-transferase CaiB-like acyl-CoA transferase